MKKLRRKDRQIETDEAKRLLSEVEYGVLSTVDKNSQPYGVPLNYAYKNNSMSSSLHLTCETPLND